MESPLRTVPRRTTVLARLAAACTVGMALTVATALAPALAGRPDAGSPAPYSVVVAGTVVMLSLLAAAAMWCTNAFEARLAVVLLAPLTALGQVVVGTLGAPGEQGPATWSVTSSLVVLLGVAVPALVTLDVRNGARNRPPEHPYAL